MAAHLGKLLAAMALLASAWSLSPEGAWRRGAESWVRPTGAAPGPVRILQFYSNVGSIKAGETAMLCYGVENAKSVRIAPLMEGEAPSPNRCLEVSPLHTTHYTILAEGFDGHLAMQSLTLPVATAPAPQEPPRQYAIACDPSAGPFSKLPI
jgi:hypothetical protein